MTGKLLRRLEDGEFIRLDDVFFCGGRFGARAHGCPFDSNHYYSHFRPICPTCSTGNGDYTDLIDGQCPVCGGEK